MIPKFPNKTAFVLALMLIAISIFAFSGMNGVNCDSITGAMNCSPMHLDMIDHHVTEYTVFMQAFAPNSMAGLLYTILAAISVLDFYIFKSSLTSLPAARFSSDVTVVRSILARRKIYRWLSLFENSPAS